MTIKRISSGTGLKYLRERWRDVDRYLSEFYYNYEDRDIIKYFFYENSVQAMTIVEDHCTTDYKKIEIILNQVRFGKSKIIIVVGARGSGKTGLSMFLTDELHKKEEEEIFYFVGEDLDPDLFPPFIKVVEDIEKVPRFSFAIVDEASLKYSARRSMKEENVMLTGLIATARHRDLTILFITQHLALIDIDIFRMRDIIFYLSSSDYTIGERGGRLNKQDKRYGLIRNMMQPRGQGECLFEMPSRRRFITFKFDLPDWWSDDISKLFKNYSPKEKQAKERAQKVKQIQDEKLDFIKKKAEIYAQKGIKSIKIKGDKEPIQTKSGIK